MPVFDLFSTRQKKLRGDIPDVYQYKKIDDKFRVQVVHIVKDTIGTEAPYNEKTNSVYEQIHKILSKEYGVFSLKKNERSNFAAVYEYFLETDNYEECLDIIELSFKIIDVLVREIEWEFNQALGVCQRPDDAISELNSRFNETAIGYQFESGKLIRIDSNLIHSDVVKPVLSLLGAKKNYEGANSEFLKAHEHYRHKRYKECLVDCLKSFESLMKAICEERSWTYKKTDTAKNLINICLSKNLIPGYLQNQFSSIRILLESGIPTVRNKEGGHGQGTEIIEVPEYLAGYTLHLTATNLLFLANCDKNYS